MLAIAISGDRLWINGGGELGLIVEFGQAESEAGFCSIQRFEETAKIWHAEQ